MLFETLQIVNISPIDFHNLQIKLILRRALLKIPKMYYSLSEMHMYKDTDSCRRNRPSFQITSQTLSELIQFVCFPLTFEYSSGRF